MLLFATEWVGLWEVLCSLAGCQLPSDAISWLKHSLPASCLIKLSTIWLGILKSITEWLVHHLNQRTPFHHESSTYFANIFAAAKPWQKPWQFIKIAPECRILGGRKCQELQTMRVSCCSLLSWVKVISSPLSRRRSWTLSPWRYVSDLLETTAIPYKESSPTWPHWQGKITPQTEVLLTTLVSLEVNKVTWGCRGKKCHELLPISLALYFLYLL